MNEFGLAALIASASVEQFLKEVWMKRSTVFHGTPERLGALAHMPELHDLRAFFPGHQGKVFAFGPNGFRVGVAKEDVPEFHRTNHTLYFPSAKFGRPKLEALCASLARDVGCTANEVECELFYSRAGAQATMHYDFEENFNVLLAGKKRWLLADNQHVSNPPESYVPHTANGRISITHDLKSSEDLPSVMPGSSEVVETQAGSVVYFPAATWHETETLEDSVAIVFAVKRWTWRGLLLRNLTGKLLHDADFRGPIAGVDSDWGFSEDQRHQFEEVLRPRLLTALQSMSFDELFWNDGNRYAVPRDHTAHVEATADGAAVLVEHNGVVVHHLTVEAEHADFLRGICTFKGPFSMYKAARHRGRLSWETMRKILDGLCEEGALVNVATQWPSSY